MATTKTDYVGSGRPYAASQKQNTKKQIIDALGTGSAAGSNPSRTAKSPAKSKAKNSKPRTAGRTAKAGGSKAEYGVQQIALVAYDVPFQEIEESCRIHCIVGFGMCGAEGRHRWLCSE